MKTIILAAGKSTRLLPLTKTTHQCLLGVNGRTILEHQLEFLSALGVKDITVISGYFGKKVEDLSKRLGIRCEFNPFYEWCGSGISLWTVKQDLKEGFMVLFSDVLVDWWAVKGILESKNDICLGTRRGEVREEGEKAVISDGVIKRITKDPVPGEHSEFIGIAKFSRNGAGKYFETLSKFARKNTFTPFIGLIEDMIKEGNVVNSYDIENSKFVDIDFPEDLESAEDLFR